MTATRRDFLLTGAAFATALAVPPIAFAGTEPIVSGRSMGTTWRATVPAGMARDEAHKVIAGVFDHIDRVHSPYRADSELSAFNAAPAGRLSVSSDLATVFQKGLDIARLTHGAFNPTVGGHVNRFGFGPIKTSGESDFADIRVSGRSIIKQVAGVTFDPCAIAKGYALDLAAAALRARGGRDFLIELGGEVIAFGSHPDGRPWQAGIERPDGSGAVHRALRLENRSLATSGDSHNRYQVGSRIYHHIIDPATGAPTDNKLASVSVIAATAMEADALATALMVLGDINGLAFADAHDIAALFISREGDGFREVQSAAMQSHIVS